MSQTKGLKRDTIDKFYTKESTVDQCIAAFKNHISISDSDMVIEPSAGSGAFIPAIKEITEDCRFFDIEPDHPDIETQDFLTFDYKQIKNKGIHIIGNPPFGRQSSAAIRFIKYCCKFASSISFILPRSFRKDSMKNRFAKQFHLVYENNIEKNAFLVNGVEYDVPCVFQIWIKKDTDRSLIAKEDPKDFEFVKKDQHPDISFRRVGVNAGMIMKESDTKSEQSHYFIKFKTQDSVDDIMKQLEKINFDSDNTVGPKSISKQELIKEFNKIL